MLQVGIDDDAGFAGGVVQPRGDCDFLAEVAREGYGADAGINGVGTTDRTVDPSSTKMISYDPTQRSRMGVRRARSGAMLSASFSTGTMTDISGRRSAASFVMFGSMSCPVVSTLACISDAS